MPASIPSTAFARWPTNDAVQRTPTCTNILNEMDGAKAPELAEGTVLIDEIDLHLHPRWQRIVLDGLRSAFPKLQFIVSTHSPQVLCSAENRRVHRLAEWQLVAKWAFVEGRDSHAILRDQMNTTDRDEDGLEELRRLHDAIDLVGRLSRNC